MDNLTVVCAIAKWGSCSDGDCYALEGKHDTVNGVCGCSRWLGVYGTYPFCDELGTAAYLTAIAMAFGMLFKLGIVAWVAWLLVAATKSAKSLAELVLTVPGWAVISCGLSSVFGVLWHLFYLVRTVRGAEHIDEWLYYPAYVGQLLRDLFLMQASVC